MSEFSAIPDRRKIDTSSMDRARLLQEFEKIEDRYIKCSELLEKYIKRLEQLERTVEDNSDMVGELKELLTNLTLATEGLVSAWTTANNVQKFIKWVSGIGLLGIVISWIIDKLPDHWL